MKDTIEKIKKHEEELASLKKKLEQERKQRLLDLPKEAGYDSVEELIEALREVSGKTASGRTKITPELKGKIEGALRSGKKGSEVSREFGISVPTVQTIKKKLGLVKNRKK